MSYGNYAANFARYYHPQQPQSNAGDGDSLVMSFNAHKKGDYQGARVFGRYKEKGKTAAQELGDKLEKGPDGPSQDYAPMSMPTDRHDTELDRVRYGESVPVNPNTFNNIAQNIDNNTKADDVRFGGVYSPQGLQKASGNSILDAQDSMMLKRQLIGAKGIGGQYAVGPGVY